MAPRTREDIRKPRIPIFKVDPAVGIKLHGPNPKKRRGHKLGPKFRRVLRQIVGRTSIEESKNEC